MARYLGKTLGALVLMVLVVALYLACSSGSRRYNQSTTELTDHLGRVAKLDKVPPHIVSLSPQNTEILFALCLGNKIVGVDTYSDFPEEAKQKPKIGGFSTVDVENVISLSPDLVVAALIHEKQTIPQLESHGLKVLALAPKTLSEVTQAIELVGNATGTEQKAPRMAEDMDNRMATVAKLVANLSAQDKRRVFFVVWHDPLMTAGRDTLESQLIDFAGGRNIFDDLTYYPTVGLETLLERQPQVIIADTGHGSAQNSPLDWAKSEPLLKNTEALILGKVFGIDANIASRGGPRMIDALEEMFRPVHPELATKLKD